MNSQSIEDIKMNTINQDSTYKIQQSLNSDEISIKDIFINAGLWYKFVLSKWKIVVIFILIGLGLGYYYATTKKLQYIAVTTFVLDESSGGGGQMSGLGSIIGVSLGAGGGIFQGDNLFELYKSRAMITKALLSKIIVNGKSEALVDRYLDFTGTRASWREKNLPWKDIVFKNNISDGSRIQDSIINRIVKDINKKNLDVSKLDKKLSILKVEVTAEDEIFAKEFNEQIVKNVNDFYVQTKTGKSVESLNILQYQADSLKAELNKNITSIASSIDANPNANPARQILRVPSQRGQINSDANKAMLTEMLKNLEVTKMSLRRETPLIQVVDGPLYPLDQEKFSKIIGAFIGGFLAAFFVIIYFTIIGMYKFIMKN